MADKNNRPTPEQINAAYKAGLMTAADRNDKMRLLAGETLEDIIENQGIVKTYFTQTLKHVQENWEDFLQMADDYKPPKKNDAGAAANEALDTFRRAGRLMWDQIGMLTAPIQAFQEVNGATARRWAQDAGASPGLSALIATVVNVGSGFVTVAKTSQLFAKAIQKNVPEMAAAAAKIAGTGKTAGDAAKAAQAAKAVKQAEKLADETVARSLVDDGIPLEGLEGFVDDTAKLLIEPQKKLPAPDDFYKSLRKYYNEIKDITETKHLKDIEAEADKLGIHLDDLKSLSQGKPLTPAEIKAYLKTLDEPTTNLIDNARRVLAGDANAGLRQDSLLTDYFSYTPKFRAAEVAAGRTVKVLDADPRMKSITEMMAAWDPENMAKLNIEAARRTIAEDLVALADETEKLKALQLQAVTAPEKGSPTFWTQLREGYINLLLARPVTQVRNLLGNSFAAANSVAERELAGWLSIDDANGIVKGEGMKQLQGMMAGIADGITGLKNSFVTFTPEEASKLDFIPHQIPGALGRIINVPGDTMRGMDNFFKAVLKRGDIYAQALEKGSHMGLEGGALADYMARRVNMPTSAMLEHAKGFADYQTYANDLGTIGKRFQGALQTGPLVYLFPFMKTPMNLAKYAWNRTPGLQLLSKSLYDDILAGGPRADMAVARLTLSNMMGMFWYGMAKQGLVTGGGPADPQLRRSWMATKQPYSIMGKNGWYPMVGIEPATTTINLISDFAEIHNQLDDPTAEQTAMAIALSGVRDIVDKSYWQSVGQMVEFIGAARAGEEPGQHALRLAQGPAITAASGGPFVAGVSRAIDPVRREARGFVDQIRARIPGFSAEMPPMRDGYGDPILPPQPLGNKWLGMVSPFVYRPEETDAIKKEGARLQAKLPMFPWSLGGKVRDDFDLRTAMPGEQLPVPLTPQQRDRWQVIYRNILRSPDTGLEVVMQSDEYKNATWAQQRKLFMDHMAKSRASAKGVLMLEDTELAKKATMSKVESVLPFLPQQQHADVQQQATEELDLLDALPPDEKDNLLRWGILDSGKERDEEVIRGPIRAEINKPIEELNRAADQQGQ